MKQSHETLRALRHNVNNFEVFMIKWKIDLEKIVLQLAIIEM